MQLWRLTLYLGELSCLQPCLSVEDCCRDALETCSILDEKSKQACYAQFGCDGKRVERYFSAVEHLENAWQQGMALLSIQTASCFLFLTWLA